MNPTSKTTSKTTSNKRKSRDASASVGSTIGEEESRPPGVKAMKKMRKKGNQKAAQSVDFNNMWEAKQKDMKLKKQCQQMSLLDTLIARKETLDEEEIALKKKLVAEVEEDMGLGDSYDYGINSPLDYSSEEEDMGLVDSYNYGINSPLDSTETFSLKFSG
ncbi:hypothetical protein ARALYDRAFT_352548 [Arabidopsis lyrata subsp. lyrata]|uniref:No apical meristem-associated C-terminal domain-containing protein n=1 Tax=Arabidopsis lyrata subsp. lyrata TaxID=81972 RepID=D7M3D3_ARALL|nr:hypothetical protein ARALYDRAFT_352548 [Arabidopsis lyrata subsp. lyrata]